MRLRISIVASLIAALALAVGVSACGGGDDGPSVAGFCKSYVAFNDTGDAFDNIDDSDVEAGKAAIADSVDALDDLAANSPDEIKSDVEDTRDWFQGASDAIADADTTAEVEDAGSKFTATNPQPTEAYSAIDSYASDNCDGADAADGSSSDTTDTTSTDAG